MIFSRKHKPSSNSFSGLLLVTAIGIPKKNIIFQMSSGFRSKLDHMIVVVIIDKVDEVSAIDANKRAFDRIFSTLPDSPSVLLYFTEAAAEKLDANKPGAQLSIYYHRKACQKLRFTKQNCL